MLKFIGLEIFQKFLSFQGNVLKIQTGIQFSVTTKSSANLNMAEFSSTKLATWTEKLTNEKIKQISVGESS